jgi:hypothetical protein
MEPAFLQVAAHGPGDTSEGRYMELAHPYDVARRIVEGGDPTTPADDQALSIRYGLFGHDLEKGVILRGRLRGLWISKDEAAWLPAVAIREFLDRPPPLGR